MKAVERRPNMFDRRMLWRAEDLERLSRTDCSTEEKRASATDIYTKIGGLCTILPPFFAIKFRDRIYRRHRSIAKKKSLHTHTLC